MRNITETEVNKGDVAEIFKQATSSFRPLRNAIKGKVSVNDLQKEWASAGYPSDTYDISQILKKNGYGKNEIKKVFSKVFGETDDGDHRDPGASAAIQKIADYCKANGMADDVKAFMQKEFGKELNAEPGMMGKIKGMFGKKSTVEEVRQIFTEIIKEERSEYLNIIKEEDKNRLGRTKKSY